MIKIRHQNFKEEDQDQKLSLDKELFLTVGIFKFYFVNGAYVRKYQNIDFCLAGHHRRYEFIPDNEFWLERNLLDQTLMQLDMKFDLLHEILENLVMALLGIDYDTAHSIYANGIEGFLRNDFKNGKSINESIFFKDIIKKLTEEVRIISPNEKIIIDDKWVRPGDYLSHYKFGVGQVTAIDLKSYSMPMITFLPNTENNEKNAIYRSAHEFKQLSGSELRSLHNKSKLKENINNYPIINVGQECDGLEVLKDIPNLSSISASFNYWEYKVLKGIRKIPINEFDAKPANNFYAKHDIDYVHELADQIKASKQIKPLIVVHDKKGLYVLEGGHRLVALFLIGVKHIPGLIVDDLTSIKENNNEYDPTIPIDKLKHELQKIGVHIEFFMTLTLNTHSLNPPYTLIKRKANRYKIRGNGWSTLLDIPLEDNNLISPFEYKSHLDGAIDLQKGLPSGMHH